MFGPKRPSLVNLGPKLAEVARKLVEIIRPVPARSTKVGDEYVRGLRSFGGPRGGAKLCRTPRPWFGRISQRSSLSRLRPGLPFLVDAAKVKWHKAVFKQSGRLVVDEIADGSVLCGWNERAPPQLQLAYGDRLLRVNGANAEEGPAAKATAKMRAELQAHGRHGLGAAEYGGEGSTRKRLGIPLF